MTMYHVLDNVTAVCALGDRCWVEGHYPDEASAKATAAHQPNWNMRTHEKVLELVSR